MLKKAVLHPPCPRRAETRQFPGFVLAHSNPATRVAAASQATFLNIVKAYSLKYRSRADFQLFELQRLDPIA